MAILNNRISISGIKQRSRSATKAANILGYKASSGVSKPQKYRKDVLNDIDKYYNSAQYDHLPPWSDFMESDGQISSRDAKPKIIYPFLRVLSDRLSAKLLGQDTYPDFKVSDDPDFEFFGGLVERESLLKAKVQSSLKKFAIMGSAFIRTKVSNGKPEIERYDSKFCYPEFDGSGDLIKITIKYIFEDDDDLDQNNNPKLKWYKMELAQMQDNFFDTPEYVNGSEPEFTETGVVDHQLGFVQGVWFRTSFENHSPDGATFVDSALFSFIDEFNYNISKSSNASEYGIDPQLIISNMTEDEIDDLVKSTANAWAMGREGKASFLEVSQSGLDAANTFREDHLMKKIMDIARIVLLDPEKIVGSAQSGKAMEVLHGPMVDFINELRPYVEAGLSELYKKVLATLIELNRRGFELAFTMPPQYIPKSFDITFSWPPIFPMTAQDKQQTISYVLQMATANIISRETALKWLIALLPEIPIESIDDEIMRVNSQQQFNTFGF